MGPASYRTARRIFAVMRPDGLYLNLPQERREFLFEADPVTFVKYMWGKTANVIVQIAKISKTELASLVHEAWEHNKPVAKKQSLRKNTIKPISRHK
ncbi:MAG TPA: MmcQ/YjbR family DNA-binding protein [Rhizomicrobium sp.]|nr:MmcQ/YjbR family DNA-binding protein [Rhizomicrobium sp.]